MTPINFKLFRILTSMIFIYAGTRHLTHAEKILDRISRSTFYSWLDSPVFFSYSITLSGLTMLAGGLLLALGIRQKLAALLLLSALIPITLTVQLENLNDLGPFFKNVAIAGSLLLIINYKSNETRRTSINSCHAATDNNGVFAKENTTKR